MSPGTMPSPAMVTSAPDGAAAGVIAAIAAGRTHTKKSASVGSFCWPPTVTYVVPAPVGAPGGTVTEHRVAGGAPPHVAVCCAAPPTAASVGPSAVLRFVPVMGNVSP